MKLNQIPNFRVEDYQSEYSEMLTTLFISLNPFIQAVNSVLDQNVDYTANIKSLTKSYTITTFQAFSLTWTFTDVAPASLEVVKAAKGTSTLTPTILLAPWSYDSSTRLITISSMMEVTATGIAALSGQYTFTIRASV